MRTFCYLYLETGYVFVLQKSALICKLIIAYYVYSAGLSGTRHHCPCTEHSKPSKLYMMSLTNIYN